MGKKQIINYKQVIHIGEHTIEQPDLPIDTSAIFFLDDDPKDAFWDRSRIMKIFPQVWLDFIPNYTQINAPATLRDNDGFLSAINKEDTDIVSKTYEEEFSRRRDGVFMKNEHEVIWIPGDMWFTLVWCKTKRPDKKGNYFDFRVFQQEFFILVWYTIKTSGIEGLDISKPKKTGITNLMWLCFLNWSTMTKNTNYGNMNITQDKGAKTFRDHFMYAYHGLPPVMKPMVKSKSEPDGTIVFGKQYRNSNKVKQFVADNEDELNTTVMCVPTAVNAFDVDVFEATWYDEPPKYTNDFGEIYRSNSAGTSLQDFTVGKRFLTSYTPEENSPSFLAAKELYYDSELRTITPSSSGQTKSKLICYHIPAYRSWWTSFDKYGRCNEAEAMEKILAGRAQLKDRPRELQALKRRYANDKTEAWAIGGSGSTFDLIRLGELVVAIEKEELESPETPYRVGKLEWNNPLWELGMKNKRPRGMFTNVNFVPMTDEEKEKDGKDFPSGRLREYYPIPKQQQNAALLNGRDEWNCLIPPPEFMSFYGADPTQHASGSEVIEGSKNAYHVMNKADHRLDQLYGRVATKVITHEYFYRPELPDEAYEDLVKLIIYTNSIGIVEANVPEFATRLIAEGLGRFMLVKDEDGVIRPWERYMGLANETDKSYHLIRTTSNSQENKDRLELFVALMKRYFHRPAEGEKDYGATIKSARLINQCANVDTTNTKIFDLFMSWGYCLTAEEMYSIYRAAHANDNVAQMGFAAVLSALAS